ncbi:MAG TPA: hypothetical protein VK995_02840, partial [Oceanipulchritudo sp.]|nr:hypothetical protein [Oceanipulchritudo sp.]
MHAFLALTCSAFFLAIPVLESSAISPLILDRAAVERVYYEHRTGSKQPFEEVMPDELLAKLVDKDLHKEAVLQKRYGITITEEQVMEEVQRINASTRAPEVLAEIKAALDNDPVRFGRIVAKPILVDKELRRRFENDPQLHAEKRKEAGIAREAGLAAKGKPIEEQVKAIHMGNGQVYDVIWLMTARPESELPSIPDPVIQPEETHVNASGGRYSIQATASIAQVLSSPGIPEGNENSDAYFEDLHPELQHVLDVQLQNPGDVSAVIERPGGFQL